MGETYEDYDLKYLLVTKFKRDKIGTHDEYQYRISGTKYMIEISEECQHDWKPSQPQEPSDGR